MREWAAEEVKAAADAAGVAIERLSLEEAEQIRLLVESEYSGDGDLGWPLWEHMHGVGIHDPAARLWIADFVGSRECFILFDPQDARTGFRVPVGNDLTPLLEPLNGVEFYVTDFDAEYLLCYNHHEVLVAAGSASSWLQARIGQEEPPDG